MTRRRARTAACLAIACGLVACRGGDAENGPLAGTASTSTAANTASTLAGGAGTSAPAAAPSSTGPETLRVEVLEQRTRDARGFTQGLELDGSTRYESNGGYGSSGVQAIDDATGAVLRRYTAPAEVFAEGITKVGDALVLLTWRERRAYVLEAATLTERAQLAYDAEGWGICARDDEVVTSDGSATLTVRDPRTLAARRTVEVRLEGEAVAQLNELECVGDDVWANVWLTDRIIRIRIGDGVVTGVADVPELRPPSTKADDAAVLNGIAHDARSDTFLLTGKRWPLIYEVRFVKAGS